jgi:TusA-related sulfurtransferase
MQTTKSLNCTGLLCPIPIIKTKLELEKLSTGEILEIIADDPGFEKDIIAWCKMSGIKLLEIKKEEKITRAYVLK